MTDDNTLLDAILDGKPVWIVNSPALQDALQRRAAERAAGRTRMLPDVKFTVRLHGVIHRPYLDPPDPLPAEPNYLRAPDESEDR